VNGARFSRSDENPIAYVAVGFTADGSILAATETGAVEGPVNDSDAPHPIEPAIQTPPAMRTMVRTY